MVSVHLRMQGAVNFALMMSQLEGGCPVDYNVITDLFLQVWINAGSFLTLHTFFRTTRGYLFFQCNLSSEMLAVVMQRNMIREATAFLLDVLKPNLPEHALLQTKVCPGLLRAVFWYKFHFYLWPVGRFGKFYSFEL